MFGMLLMAVGIAGLIPCAIILGMELFREANREAEIRSSRKQAKRNAVKFRGMNYWQEELAVRKLLKAERRRLY